jgi:Predicted transcriptional regulators
MYEGFTAERIGALRTKKGVSARDMSLSIGQSENYINKIENRQSMPSLQGLFYICEYLGVTPMEFFDEASGDPAHLNELVSDLKKLDDAALSHVHSVVRDIIREK